MNDKSGLIQLAKHGDEKGHLVVIEQFKDLPFEIKRVFYIYGTKNHTNRGMHANKQSHFFCVNLSGSCKIEVDDGSTKINYFLDTPHTGLYIPNMLWKKMYDFSSDSILLILSSHLYDPNEYIYNYEEYLKYRGKK